MSHANILVSTAANILANKHIVATDAVKEEKQVINSVIKSV